MSEAISPDDGSVGPSERLHPLFLLSGLGGSLRGVAGAYALIGYLLISGRWTTALFGGIALLAVMAVGVLLFWTRFEYRVGASDIRIDSGILSRRHRSIPFDRIQDVDITQGPFARLAGLAKVRFETGAAAGPNAEEGVLHAIAMKRAEEIRTLVRSHHRTGMPLAPAGTEEATQPAIYAMSLRRLLLAGTFNFSLAVFAGLFGLTQTFGDVLGFDPFSRGFWLRVLNAGDPLARLVLEHRVVAGLAGAALLVSLGLATGILRTLLRDWGFRLDRTEPGLRRRRGLLTRTDVTLPVKRAQAVIIATGPVRDRFGWRELKLQSLAQDEGGRGDHVLAPLADHEEVGVIVSQLGWRPLPDRVDWVRVSIAYVWIRLTVLAPLFALISLQAMAAMLLAPTLWRNPATAGVSLLAPSIALLVVLAAAFARWFAWGRTNYAIDVDRLLIRTGWWRRRLVILPATKIQSIDLSENFVSRWFEVASLRFGVAGGMQGHSIPAIPRQRARELRDQLLSVAR